MKNIVILAAGPSKGGRNRHLEINSLNNKIIIDDVIEKCTIENTNLYIVIDKNNQKIGVISQSDLLKAVVEGNENE